MTIKYIGLLLICFSISVYGAKLSEEIMKKQKAKREVLQLLKVIESGIRYGNVSLKKTLQSFTSPTLEKSGFLEYLRKNGCITEEICEKAFLTDGADKAGICNFFEKIGKSTYSEKELLICKEYINRFSDSVSSSEAEAKAKADLYKKLGILTGIATMIIFI